MKKLQKILLSLALLLIIMPFGNIALGAMNGVADPGQSNPFYLGCTPDKVPGIAEGIGCLINNVINILLGITFVAATIAVVLAGVMYMTSAGDANRAGTAKKYLTYTLIAVAVIAGAKMLISLAEFLVGLSS